MTSPHRKMVMTKWDSGPLIYSLAPFHSIPERSFPQFPATTSGARGRSVFFYLMVFFDFSLLIGGTEVGGHHSHQIADHLGIFFLLVTHAEVDLLVRVY